MPLYYKIPKETITEVGTAGKQLPPSGMWGQRKELGWMGFRILKERPYRHWDPDIWRVLVTCICEVWKKGPPTAGK